MSIKNTLLPLSLATALLASTAASAQTELNLIMIEGLDKTAMETLARQFEAEHPQVHINIQALPWSQFFQVSELRMQNRNGDLDLIYTDAPMIASYATKGYLQPMTSQTLSEARDTLTDAAFEAGYIDDSLYSLPMNSSAQVLFYNRDLLTDAGAELPAGLSIDGSEGYSPQQLAGDARPTLEALLEAAQAVKAANPNKWGLAFEQHGELYQLQPLGESLGSPIISDDGMTADGYLNSDAWHQAAVYWNDLFNVSEVSPRSLAFGEAAQLFISGQLAMFVGGTWNIPAIADSDIDFGISSYPKFAEGEAVTPTGSWYLSVAAGSEHPDLAEAFTRYATLSAQGTEQWFDDMQQVPTTQALVDRIINDDQYDQFPNSVMRLGVIESVTSAKVRPITGAYSQLQSAFRNAFVDISNGVDIDAALNNAVRQYDNAARRLNR